MITDIYNSVGQERGYYDHSVGGGVLRNWWEDDLLEDVRSEFMGPGKPLWYWFNTEHEKMFKGSDPIMWSTALRELLGKMREAEFVSLLEDLTGVGPLRAEVGDGGYHLVPPSGYQQPHVPGQPTEWGWHRFYVEVLLNKSWEQQHDGGELALYNNKGLVWEVTPEFNCTAVVKTDGATLRGVRPTNRGRWSVVMNYYSDTPPENCTVPQPEIWMNG